jgi:hypothetical protein
MRILPFASLRSLAVRMKYKEEMIQAIVKKNSRNERICIKFFILLFRMRPFSSLNCAPCSFFVLVISERRDNPLPESLNIRGDDIVVA